MFAKASEVLFAVNSSGRVFYLSSSSLDNPDGSLRSGSNEVASKWLEIPYMGIDFKRLSAATPQGGYGGRLWAIGGDHQVYVFVFGVEVPIKVKEVTYENQRWNPIEGFCNKLLPTDRHNFSNAAGSVKRNRDDVKLPTMAWQWDSDWYVDRYFQGKSLDSDGWTYAVDFPSEYGPSKRFTSCVRRRKWIRYRKYVALDSWSAVPPLHKDVAEEPFIDISVGGQEIPNGDPNELCVWAVTVLGRVIVRQGVTATCPEGNGWLSIPTPDKCEVSQISVSRSGLVWAVTWNGRVLIRLGVTRVDPTGTHWCDLDSPSPNSRLSHVSVGEFSVWALSRDQKVWFRNGVRAASAGENSSLAKGSKWIEMVGEMKMLSVGPGDQVFGITDDSFSIVYRKGVTQSDLSGKTWEPLTVQPVRLRSFSNASSRSGVSEQQSQGSSRRTHEGANPQIVRGSCNAAFRSQSTCEDVPVEDKRKAVSRSLDHSMYQSALESLEEANISETAEDASEKGSDKASQADSLSNIIVDNEDYYGDHEFTSSNFSEPQWVWVDPGSCHIDASLGPPQSWFTEIYSSHQSLSGEPWRIHVLQCLRDRNDATSRSDTYESYNNPIERTSWVRKTKAYFHPGDPKARFEICTLELEQTGSPQGNIDFGTLSIFGTTKKSKDHLSLHEITAVYQSGDKTLTVQTANRSLNLQPLQIRFNGDVEMEEWQADIVNGVNSVLNINGPPSHPGSIFNVTARGEVLVFDPKTMVNEDHDSSSNGSKLDGQYTQEIDIKNQALPIIRGLENGFTKGCVLSFTIFVPSDAKRFHINLHTGKPSLEADVAIHFNPRFEDNQTVLNSRTAMEWSDEEKHPLCIIQDDGNAIKALKREQIVQLVIKSEADYFQFYVNGTAYCRFKHRIKPEEITHFSIGGQAEVKSVIYHSKNMIIPPNQMIWRCLGGGHFLQVETCASGVTWALGYDCKPWVYTGGWGGAHFKGSTSKIGIGFVDDSKFCYVYENQRWNPITGFTSTGLPTDRYSWSDRTGKIAMTKDSVKPPSFRWNWVSDWLIDYTTHGGVDKDGWQYATDFPVSYHKKCKFTDYVRRRRWARRCKIQTTGPWKQIGATKLIDLSIRCRSNTEFVDIWAVASDGNILHRENARLNCPEGTNWVQVPADIPFQSVSVGQDGKVWAISKEGSAFLRHGISDVAPTGQFWIQVHQPNIFGTYNSNLRSISVGGSSFVWAVDAGNRLYLRQEVSNVFPEGSSWKYVASEVKSISANGSELWAVLQTAAPTTYAAGIIKALEVQNGVQGVLARRAGITPDNPLGTGWDVVTGGGIKNVSIKGKSPARS